MPLATSKEAPVERGMSAGFRLVMRDGERDVSVIVSHEALGLFQPGAPDPKQSLAEHRATIEAAASAKYDRGEISRNGHVLVTSHDLV